MYFVKSPPAGRNGFYLLILFVFSSESGWIGSSAVLNDSDRRNFRGHTRALLHDWLTGQLERLPRGRQKSHKYRLRHGHLRELQNRGVEGPTGTITSRFSALKVGANISSYL